MFSHEKPPYFAPSTTNSRHLTRVPLLPSPAPERTQGQQFQGWTVTAFSQACSAGVRRSGSHAGAFCVSRTLASGESFALFSRRSNTSAAPASLSGHRHDGVDRLPVVERLLRSARPSGRTLPYKGLQRGGKTFGQAYRSASRRAPSE